MKSIMIKVISFLLIFCVIPIVNATNIVKYANSNEICDAIKTNSKITISVKNNGKTYFMKSDSNDCNNSSSFVEGNTDPYVNFYRGEVPRKIYIDDILVKEAKATNEYSYFAIYNQDKGSSNDDKTKTLKPTEKVYINLNINNKNLKINNKKDLRLKIQYAATGSDINIAKTNSISYYVVTSSEKSSSLKVYGPYELVETNYVNVYRMKNAKDDKYANHMVYDLISDNLYKNIPNGEDIKKIQIVPYDNYTIRKGAFKIYNMSLDEYDAYSNGKKYQPQNNAEKHIREHIVDNMMENATVKWKIIGIDKKSVYYYCNVCKKPSIIGSSDKVIYGMLYSNQYNSTVSSFLSHATKSSDNSKVYLYNLKNVPEKNRDSEYVYIRDHSTTVNPRRENSSTYKEDIKNHNFANNDNNYILGLDCSGSTSLAVSRELPYTSLVINSYDYFNKTNHVINLAGTDISINDIEKYARAKGYLTEDMQMTDAIVNKYISEFIKNGGKVNAADSNKNSVAQKIYSGYAKLEPGDIISRYGHATMATGYSYVECNKKDSNGETVAYNVINDKNQLTRKYGIKNSDGTYNNCAQYGGINPKKSYVIRTEITSNGIRKGIYNKIDETTYQLSSGNKTLIKYGLDKAVASNHTGWTYRLNSNLTDLKTIDEYFSKERTTLWVNTLVTFEDLYDRSEELDSTPYLPFRYKEMDNLKSNKIEVPFAKLVLDKEYSNINNAVYDDLKESKKLKGVIFTNYIIDTIKIEINNKPYYIYPNQTNYYLLYSDITDSKILKAIENIDYSSNFTLKLSVKVGPNSPAVRKEAGADNDGYINVININHKKETTTPTPIASFTIRGDVDDNGKVNVLDYIAIRKHGLKMILLTGDKLKRADVNGDGKVSNLDYWKIREIIESNARKREKIIFEPNNSEAKEVVLFEDDSLDIE